jgi:outer membrane protein assembly factor BamE
LASRSPSLPARAAPLLAVVVAGALASGCATVESYLPTMRSLGVYKLDVNQGNYLTQDMVAKLKEGQTRSQVRAILGTPLVTSAFRDDRWDYVYEYTRQGRLVEHRAFTVYFVGDNLARWEGDEMPPSVADLNRAAADRSLGQAAGGGDPGMFDWLFGIFRR